MTNKGYVNRLSNYAFSTKKFNLVCKRFYRVYTLKDMSIKKSIPTIYNLSENLYKEYSLKAIIQYSEGSEYNKHNALKYISLRIKNLYRIGIVYLRREMTKGNKAKNRRILREIGKYGF